MTKEKKYIKPKPNDKALSEAEALTGAEITSVDLSGTLARWKKLVPDFKERIERAASGQTSERWMTAEVASRSWAIEDQLLETWKSYLQAVGPSVVRAYREGNLQEFPHDHIFEQISGRMQQVARELLIAEELAQDNTEK